MAGFRRAQDLRQRQSTQGQPADFLREAILRHIRYTLVRPTSQLKPSDYLKPVSLAIRDRIVDRLLETESRYRHKDSKKLYYLSMEFLMGRSLADNLSNLRLEELCREVQAFARGQMAAYKCPRKVEFTAALPKTPSGKVKRKDLRAADRAAGERPA